MYLTYIHYLMLIYTKIKGFTIEIDSKNLEYTLKVKGHSEEQSKCIRVKEYQIKYQVK